MQPGDVLKPYKASSDTYSYILYARSLDEARTLYERFGFKEPLWEGIEPLEVDTPTIMIFGTEDPEGL